ncbi:MAG TPA: hypothetical protein PKD07_06250, partial [Microthrixaceae bacterium]|nr:hypothetical protein [Microthrixaceae bacterium]
MRRALSTFAALVLGTLAVQQIAARCFGDPWSGVARLTERWVYYDGHRYLQIAHEGYSWNADAQSTVAWFPLYPLLIRALSWLGGRPTNWAALITLVAGATAFVLYDRWAASSSWVPLGLFALMPYAFYLYGIVYADALFVALCLGAWLAFDRSAVGASVVLSALATATRPTGVALVAGLMVAGYLRRRRPADAGVQALGLVGLGAYIAFQWWRFDEPLGFLSTQRHFRAGAAPIGNTRLIEALVSGWRSASLFEVGAAVVLAAVGVGSAAWIGRRYSRGAAVAVLGFAGAFIVTIARWPGFVSFPAHRSTPAAQGLLC